MSDENKVLELIPMKHENHEKPITRRQLMAQGLIAGGAYMAVPTILSLASRTARADEFKCELESGGATGPKGVPFLCIDCSGGFAMPANFAVSKSETDAGARPTYDRMGQFGGTENAVDTRFGIHMFTGNGSQDRNDQFRSQIYQAFTEILTPEIMNKISIGGLAYTCENDSGSNRNNASTLIDLVGQYYSGVVGTRNNSQAGGNADPAYPVTGTALSVGSPADLLGAVGGAVGLGQLSVDQRKRVADSIIALGDQQKGQLGRMNSAAALAAATNCAQRVNRADLEKAPEFDPRNATAPNSVYRLAEQNIAGDLQFNRRLRDAALVNALLNGYTGACTIEQGGCDYHGNNRTNTNSVDLQIGLTAARAIRLAAELNQKILINIITDGGIGFGQNSPNPQSDNRSTSYSVLIYFDPAGKRAMRKVQVGRYTDNQSVDRTHFIDGGEGRNGAIATYINWLNLSFGESGLGAKVAAKVPSADFDPARIGDVLLFG